MADKTQDELIRLFVQGATARTAAKRLRIQPNTTALFYHKLRLVIAKQLQAEAIDRVGGVFELDRSSFPKDPNGMHPLFGIIKRGGFVFTKTIESVDVDACKYSNSKEIIPDSVVYSDIQIGHKTIDLAKCDYQRLKGRSFYREPKSTNRAGVDDFWFHAKAGLKHYRGIPIDQLNLFIKESEFRFNHATEIHRISSLRHWISRSLSTTEISNITNKH